MNLDDYRTGPLHLPVGNLTLPETIYSEQLIAVVSASKRGEKRISVDALSYRIYSRVWCWLFPVRKFWRMLKTLIKKCLRRL